LGKKGKKGKRGEEKKEEPARLGGKTSLVGQKTFPTCFFFAGEGARAKKGKKRGGGERRRTSQTLSRNIEESGWGFYVKKLSADGRGEKGEKRSGESV